jgi:hypothetical protein
VISVVGRPVELITVVLLIDCILRLVPSSIDECKGLAQYRFFPDPHSPLSGYKESVPETAGSKQHRLGCDKYSS